jgi:hypothetical protein
MKRAISLGIICCAMVINLMGQEPYEGTTLPGVAERLQPLHRVASDAARPAAERDAALVKIFQECLKSGFDSGEILSGVKGASWLNQVKISECFGVGGMLQVVPSCSNVRDKSFRLHLYSTWDKPHTYAIEFRFRGALDDGSLPEPETVLEFLKGQDVPILNAELTELAVCSPRADQVPGRHVVHYDAQGTRMFDVTW